MVAILDGNLRKIEIAFLEDGSGPTLYQIHSASFQNCHFHVFATFSKGNH